MRYFHRVWFALNQLTNALFGGAPDETISSRLGRQGCSGPFSEKHCETAIENERRGSSQSRALRPTMFLTRRAALQSVALLMASSSVGEPAVDNREVDGSNPSSPTIVLDTDVTVIRGGRMMTIDADALWHALESAQRIPL